MKVKDILILLFIGVILLFPSISNADENEIEIFIDNNKLDTETKAYLEGDVTMVPLEEVVEAVGGDLEYNSSSYPLPAEIVTHPRNPLGLAIFKEKPVALISEGAYRSDLAPTIKEGKTMVPLRFIAEYLGYEVNYDQENRNIYLNEIDDDIFYERYWDEESFENLSELLIEGNLSPESFSRALN